MDKQSLTYKTFKNVAYNFMGSFWPIIFAIFITPIVVLKLGAEKYGVYMLVMSISSLMGLFDLGLGSTFIKYISEYAAKDEREKIKKLVYTFNIFLLGLAIFCLILFLIIGYFASSFFPSQIMAQGYYFTIFLLAGLSFFIHNIGGTYATVPLAVQRFDINTKIGMASLTLSNLTTLTLVLLGYELRAIFLTQLIFTCVLFFIYRHYAIKLLPDVQLKYRWHKDIFLSVYKFSITAYASNAANSALTYFDRLLIPIFIGPAALSYYSLPGNITAKTPSLANNISAVIFPMISNLNGLQDTERIKHIYIRVFNLITVISFAITVSIIMFSDKILLYWLNADFADKSTGVLVILAITYYFLSLSGILNSFLLGLGKTNFLFKSSVTMAIINIVSLFYLLPKFGIMGAAWAYLISVLPVIYMFFYSEKKFFNLSNRGAYYLKLYSKLFIVSIFFIFIIKYLLKPLVSSLTSVIIIGPLSVVLFLIIYRLFAFYEKKDLEVINNFLKMLYLRINRYIYFYKQT